MIRPPYLARVAVGAVVFAIEETRKLPATAASLPMNAISQVLQTTMHAQQFLTSLAIKGDEALEPLLGAPEEQPEWATFDDDEIDAEFAQLVEVAAEPAEAEPPAAILAEIDYPALTLAQLRARLRYLSLDDLSALLAYEQQHDSRAPFVTMLSNRIATTMAK